MYTMQDRRRFLATLSSAGAAGLIGASNSVAHQLFVTVFVGVASRLRSRSAS
jgi:hypothetical protein